LPNLGRWEIKNGIKKGLWARKGCRIMGDFRYW